MIRIEKLERHYSLGGQRIAAVDQVDLSIAEGEFVALLGPSGSGKSTLMHVLGGLDKPDSGSVVVDGRDISRLSADAAAQYRGQNVGFVFQAFHLHPQLTALENVALPLALAGQSSAERERRARELLELVGLGGRLEHRPSELSGGQQQRVSIARALANEPRILLADEPTGNLDSKTGREVMELFERLHKERGITLVIVTHDPDVASRAGRVVRLRDGRIESIEGEERRSESVFKAKVEGRRAGALSWVGDGVREVLRSFSRHPLRFALTAFGITVGGLAITLMVGMGLGLQEFIATQAESINDPLSLGVTNSSFSMSDIVGNRAQQLGRVPVPLEMKSLEQIAKARSGFDRFSEEQIAAIASTPGVEDVRPQTFAVLDGLRLVEVGQERMKNEDPKSSDRVGEVEDFPEVFFIGYALVRGRGTQFRLACGRNFEVGEERACIVSYQYAEAWGLKPEELIGREVELLFPELAGYTEFNNLSPQNIKARYLGQRVKIVGLTTKSILSSAVFLPPGFGEDVVRFQFASGDPEATGGLALLPRLQEISELARDQELIAGLQAGDSDRRSLAQPLKVFAAASGGERSGVNPLMLMGAMEQARQLSEKKELSASLGSGTTRERRLWRCLEALFQRSKERALEEGDGAKRSWGSRIRVRVKDDESLPGVVKALKAKGYRVRSLQDNLAALSTVFTVINTLLSSFGVIALFVAASGIANTLIMAVYERTSEIGVMKAVGATNTQIRRLFSMEAAAIGLIGGSVGACSGLAIGVGFNTWGIPLLAPEWEGFQFFSAPLPLVFASILFCSLISLLAGLYPAQRAASLDPIVALRSE